MGCRIYPEMVGLLGLPHIPGLPFSRPALLRWLWTSWLLPSAMTRHICALHHFRSFPKCSLHIFQVLVVATCPITTMNFTVSADAPVEIYFDSWMLKIHRPGSSDKHVGRESTRDSKRVNRCQQFFRNCHLRDSRIWAQQLLPNLTSRRHWLCHGAVSHWLTRYNRCHTTAHIIQFAFLVDG